MQELENNMDDLFRKAAADYPLKTGESKWEEVASGLAGHEVNASVTYKKNSNKKRYTGLLMMLLLFLFVGGIFINYSGYKNKKADLKKPSTTNEIKNATIEVNHRTKDASAFPDKQNNEVEPNPETNYIVLQNRQKTKDNIVFKTKNKFIKPVISGIINKEKEHSLLPGIVDTDKSPVAELRYNMENYTENTEIKQIDEANTPVTTVKSNRVIEQKENKSNAQNSPVNKVNPLQKQHGAYFGFVLGPAFNEVKSQGLKKPGFELGIIAGYKINKRISAETGLLFAKKYYYSDGKYFDMSKMPAGMQVLSLEGSSTVFEIPVKFRYNLLSKNITSLFTSAGISSYILSKEKNNYSSLNNGTPQNITSTYRHTYGYIAASVDISLGYERKIGKLSSIRFEPYLKIPLKGIGVGSMPVMSTGLHIGITRQVH